MSFILFSLVYKRNICSSDAGDDSFTHDCGQSKYTTNCAPVLDENGKLTGICYQSLQGISTALNVSSIKRELNYIYKTKVLYIKRKYLYLSFFILHFELKSYFWILNCGLTCLQEIKQFYQKVWECSKIDQQLMDI